MSSFPSNEAASLLVDSEPPLPSDIRPLVFPWVIGSEPWPKGRVNSYISAFGWPARSLACAWQDGSDRVGGWTGLLRIPNPNPTFHDPPGLPVYILPRGFAINTALAAVLWSLVLLAVPAARRMHRRRHGRCAACGYDLRTLPAGTRCPECGCLRGAA